MTVELLDEASPNAMRVIVAWLRPLGRVGTYRLAGDPLPFRLVNRVAGADDPILGIDSAVISIHTFATRDTALDESDLTHARLLYLARHTTTEIELPDDSIATISYLETIEKPIQVDYGDPNLTRYVGRYRIGLDFVH